MSSNFTPERRKVFNQLDEWGVLLDTPRLADEDNVTYKRRLLDVFAHRANATYTGLLFGLTRDFGQELYDAAEINYTGAFDSPMVLVDGAVLYLYEDYPTVAATIPLWLEPSQAAPTTRLIYLYELAATVNALPNWSMTLLADNWARASNIYNQTNKVIVPAETVPSSPTFHLKHKKIIAPTTGTAEVYFSDVDVFNPTQRKTDVSNVLISGDWYIDTTEGFVYSFGTSHDAVVRYTYIEMPYTLKASPIEIYDFANNDAILPLLFVLETADDGNLNATDFTDLGYDVLQELKMMEQNIQYG